jgi:hypothetical protein
VVVDGRGLAETGHGSVPQLHLRDVLRLGRPA